ncbi:MAG TPA: aminotransferase class V-fold PLP-dependent enzyme [Rectinemataceae bacterium]|nr:aminotransferase class V-fold PLP-dependent enzyme [Rectinemataceae bacterium]
MHSDRYAHFLERYPAYAQTESIDALRASDYGNLDACGQVYLDYTGGGLFGLSQARKHFEILSTCIYGNPHSSNPSSMAATQLVESARRYVLEYFKASPEEYLVIFTQNASGALKLVGESYPFGPGARYLLTFDNHNSVNGIREFARAKGASVTYLPVELPDLRISTEKLAEELAAGPGAPAKLFAYPAQSNFSSVQHPLSWIELAHEQGWDVLVDAAAFAPTNELDLSRWKPDFVPLSFYKMFGYPTGIGALIARRDKLAALRRPWFAGGTITVASVQGDKYYLSDGAAAFEDGTVDYLGIPAVEIGLRHLRGIDVKTVHERVMQLSGWLLDNLRDMRHSTGVNLVKIYGPVDTRERGGAITVNFYDAQGRAIDHRAIEAEANTHGISLRTGCFCNPGAGEIALGISREELATCFTGPGHDKRLSIDDFRSCITSKSTGAVRISVGLVSNFKDVETFLGFAKGFIDR